MILNALSSTYGAVATWRRRWYARHPARRRTLARPVVSVGNLSMGGSGKTPVVAYIARLLLDAGERPVILTRGYKRESSRDGVTVVSNPARVVADFAESGDEPLLLARALPGVPVLVGANRFASGRLAEEQFGATVHLLDDGFQHVALARDVDLLVADEQDLQDRVLPAGRLREPLAAASVADAVLVTVRPQARTPSEAVARALGVATAFTVVRELGEPIPFAPPALPDAEGSGLNRIPNDRSVFAVAGIARPERFFDDLRSAGWHVAGTIAFGDHHAFTQADLVRIRARADAAGARALVTTAKDAIRFERLDLADTVVLVAPLVVRLEPADAFRQWLLARVRRTR